MKIKITEQQFKDFLRLSITKKSSIMLNESLNTKYINEATINGHTIPLEKRINNWRCVDGFYMEHFITLHGKETKDSQDVR